MRLVGVEHLVGRHVGMVDRHGERPERDAVETVGQEEDARLHVLQRKIGRQHLLVQRIVLPAQLFGIVPPVPRGEFAVGVVLLEEGLHLGQFALGAFQRRSPDFVQQGVDRLGRAGHLVGRDIGGVGGIAQQAGLLGTQTHEIVDQLPVVVLVAVGAAVQIGFVDPFAQIAALGIGQKRYQTRFVEREDETVAFAQFAGFLARQLAGGGRNALEVVDRQLQREVVVLGQQVGAELHRVKRQFLVDRLETRLALLVEQGARTDEIAVGLLQQPHGVGIEVEFRAAVVDRLHFGEKPFVHADAVGVGGQQRHRLLLQGTQLLVALGFAQHAENQARLFQSQPRFVIGHDHVFERRFIVVRHDGFDLGVMQRHGALEGRHEVPGGDPVERRDAVGRFPGRKEGVFAGLRSGFARYGHKQNG